MNTKKFTVASGLGDGSVEKTLATHAQDLSSYPQKPWKWRWAQWPPLTLALALRRAPRGSWVARLAARTALGSVQRPFFSE